MDDAKSADDMSENMDVDSSESLEKSFNNTNGNINTDISVTFNEGDCSGHNIEQNMEVDSTENCDELLNDLDDNSIPDDIILSNKGVHEDLTEQNLEVDQVLDHNVLNIFQHKNPDVMSSTDLEAENEIIQMNLIETKPVMAEDETSDQPIKENFFDMFSEPLEIIVSSSDIELSEPSIEENVLNYVSKSSDETIKENLVNTSEQTIKENLVNTSEQTIKENLVNTSEQTIEENLVNTSEQKIEENLVDTSSQLLETIVSSSDVNSSESLIKENFFDLVSEKSDQPIKENLVNTSSLWETIISVDKNSTKVIGTPDQNSEKNTIVSDVIDKNMSVSNFEASNQPIKVTGSGGLTNFEHLCEKVISPLAIKKSFESLKEIILASKQPTKEKIGESFKEHLKKIVEKSDVKISEPQLKKTISVSTVGSILNNVKLPLKTEYLKLEKITIPKTVQSDSIPNQSVLSNQIKKMQPIKLISNSSFVRIQPKLMTTENNVLKQKQEIKIVSSKDSKPGVVFVPHNGMNYVVKKFKKEEPNDGPVKSNSVSSTIKFNPAGILPNFQHKKNIFTLVKKNQNGLFKVPATKSLGYCQSNSTNHFVIKSGKQSVPLKYLNAHGVKFIKQEHIVNSNRLKLISPTNNSFINSHPFTKFHTIKKDISRIPHTITSKDLIKSNANTVFESSKNKINTNASLRVLPKINGLSQPTLKIVSNVAKMGNITQNDGKNFRFIPLKPIEKLKLTTQSNVNRLTPPTFINDKNVPTKITDIIEEMYPDDSSLPEILQSSENENVSNKKKMHFTTENIKKKRKILLEGSNSKSSNLVSCNNQECKAIVFDTELIDGLYCSIDCRKLASRKRPREPTPPLVPMVKPKIDRKSLLMKLHNRIQDRRKQKLLLMNKPPSSENKPITEVNGLDKLTKEDDTYNIPNIGELSDFNAYLTSDESSSKSLEDKIDDVLCKDINIPAVPQLSDATSSQPVEESKKLLAYLRSKEYRSAPKKLFDVPFPVKNNTFKVNQKLEGIDPEHEALFCVMSVVDTRGYRIKLHFDGYPEENDFWVNADCPNLFHIKWCDEHSRPLQPPLNYGKPFDWSIYFKETRSLPAPKSCFSSSVNTVYFKNHKFVIGAKLEALDKATRTLPKQLICVATVADVIGTRIRVHFDGWNDDFDYWTSISSTNLHPIGWCDNNGRTLTPPCGYNDCRGKKPFSWSKYLIETDSLPVPENGFVRSPLREFTVEMLIEVVDLVMPSLIRVAKVVDVKDNEIKILYDKFANNYAYWIEDDNPDIHPIGWCLRTDHPLEVPPASSIWSCKVAGCNGKGNLFQGKTDHIFSKECPYEPDTWKKTVTGVLRVPDRLKPEEITKSSISAKNSNIRKMENQEKGRINKKTSSTTAPSVYVKPKNKTNQKKSNKVFAKASKPNNIYDVVRQFRLRCNGQPTLADLSVIHNRFKLLGGIEFSTPSDPKTWSVKEVAECAVRAVNNENSENPYIPHHFIDNEIDGESFLMLTKKDLLRSMKLPLGPAIKIYHTIKLLQERSVIMNNIF